MPVTYTLSWTPRPQPLEVEGVAADGAVTAPLVKKLLSRLPSLNGVRGVRAGSGLVLLGPAADLPWCDGLTYLGRPNPQSLLYMAVHLVPSLPIEWLAHSLRQQCAPPWALLPDNRVIGLAQASCLEAELLRQLLAVGEGDRRLT